MIVSRRIRFPKSSQHPFETLKGLTNFLVSIFILSSLLLSSVPQTSKDIQLFSAFFYFWFRFALLCSDPQNRSHISTLHHQKEWLARQISHQQTLMWKPSNPIKGQIPLVSLHNTALVLCAAAAVSHPLGNFIRIYILYRHDDIFALHPPSSCPFPPFEHRWLFDSIFRLQNSWHAAQNRNWFLLCLGSCLTCKWEEPKKSLNLIRSSSEKLSIMRKISHWLRGLVWGFGRLFRIDRRAHLRGQHSC